MRRKTPLMGWSSWNCFRTGINEVQLCRQIDALTDSGLAACGYLYFNIDDGYLGGRNPVDHRLLFRQDRFPHGIRPISDYAHSKGLFAGIYSDAGENTCGYYYGHEKENGRGAGLYQHEKTDLWQLLAENNFDYIKVDWCGALRLNLDEQTQYTRIAHIIREIEQEEKRTIVYNVCRWMFPGEWVTQLADSWRIGADIVPSFDSILYQIDQAKALRRFCKPGHVNDCDMLQVGNGMTEEEDKSHFAMWCMLSVPLLISCDLTRASQTVLNLLGNNELIAINQDALCEQAFVCKEYRDDAGSLTAELWVKNLADGTRAAALLNRTDQLQSLLFFLSNAGVDQEDGLLQVRDVMHHKDLEIKKKYTVTMKAHGIAVFRIHALHMSPVDDVNKDMAYGTGRRKSIAIEQAMEEAGRGLARLIDVRTAEEYEAGHYGHAVHIPYNDVCLRGDELLEERKEKIILYCASGKRAFMAKEHLENAGFKNVYLTDAFTE